MYIKYAKKVSSFNTENITIQINEFYREKEISLTNEQGDVLIFKTDKKGNVLQDYHCGLTFILYNFINGHVKKITTFGSNGKIKGDAEFNNIAIIELQIKKSNELDKKLKLISDQDGNLHTYDANEQLVLKRSLNSKGELLQEKYINSHEYWDMQYLLHKP